MRYSRRDFTKLAAAAVPGVLALRDTPLFAREYINSKVKGIQIGAQSYSFRTIPNADDIIKAYQTVGIGEMELMSGDCEKLAGTPSAGRGGRGAATADQQAAAKKALDWRMSATEATFKPVRAKIEAAGIHLGVLCYNMSETITDDMIDYAFVMAKGLGVGAMSSSTTVKMAARLAPFAEKHKLLVGFHNHDNDQDPNQMATEASFKAVFATSKYLGANFDIGHYVSANGDPIDFIKKYNSRITNLHFKDRLKNHGGPVVWGKGDVDIKGCLALLEKETYGFPCNIEMSYEIPAGSDAVAEVKKCYDYIKALA